MTTLRLEIFEGFLTKIQDSSFEIDSRIARSPEYFLSEFSEFEKIVDHWLGQADEILDSYSTETKYKRSCRSFCKIIEERKTLIKLACSNARTVLSGLRIELSPRAAIRSPFFRRLGELNKEFAERQLQNESTEESFTKPLNLLNVEFELLAIIARYFKAIKMAITI